MLSLVVTRRAVSALEALRPVVPADLRVTEVVIAPNDPEGVVVVSAAGIAVGVPDTGDGLVSIMHSMNRGRPSPFLVTSLSLNGRGKGRSRGANRNECHVREDAALVEVVSLDG